MYENSLSSMVPINPYSNLIAGFRKKSDEEYIYYIYTTESFCFTFETDAIL